MLFKAHKNLDGHRSFEQFFILVECDEGRKLFANKEILGFSSIYPGKKKKKGKTSHPMDIYHSS